MRRIPFSEQIDLPLRNSGAASGRRRFAEVDFEAEWGGVDLTGSEFALAGHALEVVRGVGPLDEHVSLRRSRTSARPPGRSTRCISLMASTGCEKFLNAAEQYTKSKDSSGNGMADAFPNRKAILTPAVRAFCEAISMKVRLMSRPVMWKVPSFASSIEKYPGPGATSSTSHSGRSISATYMASRRKSSISLSLVRAYQRAVHPSIPTPL